MGYRERAEQSKLADERLRGVKFGDPITNVCASDKNPHRLAYYVRKKGDLVQATDKKGKFWDTQKDVIFSGHLDKKECERLYAPIWEAHFK